jgi:hypothetical protein
VALKAFAEQQKANAGPTADVPDLTAMIHAENDHEQWLVVKLDLSRPVRLAGGENATQEPKLAPHYRETIDFARTHDIPIDDTLSLKQVLDGLAGK